MTTRDDIVAEARTLLEVPWRHQGRGDQGVDCVGLLMVVGMRLGLTVWNVSDYPRRPTGEFLMRFDEQLDRKLLSAVEPGDVVVFSAGRHPCHCGIVTEYRRQFGVVHAHASRRKVIEEVLATAGPVAGTPTHCYSYRGLET